jgi:hypothetical protein
MLFTIMAGKTIEQYGGFEFEAEPKAWWRRWLPLGTAFFFENYNPSFRVRIRPAAPSSLPDKKGWKVVTAPPDEVLGDKLAFYAALPNGHFVHFREVEASEILDFGEDKQHTVHLSEVPSHPGQVEIRLATPSPDGLPHWRPLYWYTVRPQEQLFFGLVGWLLVLLSSALFTTAVQALIRWLS